MHSAKFHPAIQYGIIRSETGFMTLLVYAAESRVIEHNPNNTLTKVAVTLNDTDGWWWHDNVWVETDAYNGRGESVELATVFDEGRLKPYGLILPDRTLIRCSSDDNAHKL